MMRHTLQVFIYELRRNFRRRGYLLTTFGVPLLAVVLMFVLQRIDLGGMNTQNQIVEAMDSAGIQKAGYIDETGLFGRAEIPDDLTSVLAQYADEDAARAALEAGEIEGYYIIPADYMETGKVRLVLARMSVTQVSEAPIQGLILNALTEGEDESVVSRILDPSHVQSTNLAITNTAQGGDSDAAEGANFALVYVFVIALMLSLFVTNGYLMQSVIEEKETRLIEILISTVRPVQLLAGKILAMGLLGLLQMLVWVGGIYLALRLVAGDQATMAVGFLASLASVQLPLDILPLLVVYFLLAYTLFAALYAIVGAMSNSMREGPQYAVIFTLPAVVPMYFLALFTTSPDGALPVILSLFPLTAPISMTIRVLVSSVPAWQILLSLALLAATVVAVVWAAGRLFRVQTLLAGQLPRLRELPRLLRG
jgi:ABC-2 type transport system permease protein